MANLEVKCPNCSTMFKVDDAIDGQLREEIRTQLTSQFAEREQAISSKEDDVKLKLRDLESQRESVDELVAHKLKEREDNLKIRLEQLDQRESLLVIEKDSHDRMVATEVEKQTAKLIPELEKRIRNERGIELQDLHNQNSELIQKAAALTDSILDEKRRVRELNDTVREMDSKFRERLDTERAATIASTTKETEDRLTLTIKDRDTRISDLTTQIADLKRRAEQASQQAQGETLEIELEEVLRGLFSQDDVEPVAKGAKGADVLQRVVGPLAKTCGSILWESKNAKTWSKDWIDKLKDDQIKAGADVACLLTEVMPKGVRSFALIDGVFVTDRHSLPAVASTLRFSLIQMAQTRSSVEGIESKRNELYNYFSGPDFRSRIEAIVKTFISMKAQLEQERRAMTKQWSMRDKQIERVVLNTTGLYGQLQAIVGADLAQIDQLELDSNNEPGQLSGENDASD